MTTLPWLTILAPLLAFAYLTLRGPNFPHGQCIAIGTLAPAIAALGAIALAVGFWTTTGVFEAQLGSWLNSGKLAIPLALRVDEVSVFMTLVVTVVGFFIMLFSAGFMSDEADLGRFFAAMNLFIAFMLILVLANNLLLMYLGWEGVGLCSYLLIGFWYRKPTAVRAAKKAFVVTRLGDVALAIGLLLLLSELGTLHVYELNRVAALEWSMHSKSALIAASLLGVGALAKSAQLPLHVWLPDAMEGPSPVSALIHAATMVTAGVYLVARMSTLFTLAPDVLVVLTVLGAMTAIYGAACALAQNDIKRVLAYSTISQLGYMFMALGLGAWGAALFHLMTHAFFKALLFLCAGVLIRASGGTHDLRAMGGLRKRLPLTFWAFVIAAGSLVGLPLITAGYFSKESILLSAWQRTPGLWLIGAAGTFLTALYITRAGLLAFSAQSSNTEPAQSTAQPAAPTPSLSSRFSLAVLAVLSLLGGFFVSAEQLDDWTRTAWVPGAQQARAMHDATHGRWMLELAASAAGILGIAFAYARFTALRQGERRWFWFSSRAAASWLACGLFIDRAYSQLLVRPYRWLARANRHDWIDSAVWLLAAGARQAHLTLAETQNGRLRQYAVALALGSVLLLALGVL